MAAADEQIQTQTTPAHPAAPVDQHLLTRYAQHADTEAFAILVRRYQALVFSSALRRLHGDRHAAEDVAQAVFILLAGRAAELAGKADLPLAGWLHRAAGYAAQNALRMARRRKKHERAVMTAMSASANSESPHDSAARQWLDAAIDRLNGRDRAAVLARYVQGLSVEQVGAAMGVSVEAAKKRLQRAIDKLRRMLLQHDARITAMAVVAALQDDASAAAAAISGEFQAKVIGSVQHPMSAGTAAAIAKGTWNMMWWKRARWMITTATASILILGGTAAVLSRAAGSQVDRGSAVTAASEGVAPFAWLEPREIVINDDSQRDDDCIDLDTGKTGTPGRPFGDRADGRAWFTDSGMDAHCETSDEPGENGLYGMGVAWVLVPNEAFDEMSPDEADRRLSAVHVEWDNRADADGGLPVTYLFKTKDGASGAIQITSIDRGPEKPHLALRWKLAKRVE